MPGISSSPPWPWLLSSRLPLGPTPSTYTSCAPRCPATESAPAAATALLAAQSPRFDRQAVDAVIAAASTAPAARAAAAPRHVAALSAREVEVLRRICTCAGTREAARALRISSGAVRTHAESIFAKLACSTRAAATLKALTLGLL